MTTATVQSRWPVIAAIGAVSVTFWLLYLLTGSADEAWRRLGVQSLYPSFADLRTITHSIDCVTKGIDPFVSGVCDPWNRLYNYPSTWIGLFGLFGVTSASTDLLGAVFIAMACLAFVMLFAVKRKASAAIAILAITSPPVLLGMERGNGDVFLFSILIIALTVTARFRDSVRGPVISFVISCLAALKLYPVAAAYGLLMIRRGAVFLAVTLAVSAAMIYFLIGLDEIQLIGKNTPQSVVLSYGSLTMATVLTDFASTMTGASLPGTAPRLLAIALSAVGIAIGIVLYRRHRGAVAQMCHAAGHDSTHMVAVTCCAIFCGSFILGANWDYRLIFLIGVIPFFLARFEDCLDRRFLVPAVAIVSFLWLSRVSHRLLYADELLDAMLFIAGIAFLYHVLESRFLERRNDDLQSRNVPRIGTP